MLHVPQVLRKMHTFDVHIYFHIIIRSHKRIFFLTSNQKLIRVLTKISEYFIEKKGMLICKPYKVHFDYDYLTLIDMLKG